MVARSLMFRKTDFTGAGDITWLAPKHWRPLVHRSLLLGGGSELCLVMFLLQLFSVFLPIQVLFLAFRTCKGHGANVAIQRGFLFLSWGMVLNREHLWCFLLMFFPYLSFGTKFVKIHWVWFFFSKIRLSPKAHRLYIAAVTSVSHEVRNIEPNRSCPALQMSLDRVLPRPHPGQLSSYLPLHSGHRLCPWSHIRNLEIGPTARWYTLDPHIY